MSRMSLLKLVIAGTGIVIFGYGLRADSQEIRWAGIAFVAVALVLRFVKRP